MNQRQADFRKRLLSTFRIEAQEHIKTISSGLIKIERGLSTDAAAEVLETIFRAAHSLKGAARAVNVKDVETICQSLESVFSVWKKTGLDRSPDLFDTLYKTTDAIQSIISSLEEGQTQSNKGHISGLIQELSRLEACGRGQRPGSEEKETDKSQTQLTAPQTHFHEPRSSETVRISTARLNSLLLEAEEMLSSKLTAKHIATNLKEMSAVFELLKRECTKASAYKGRQGSAKIFERISGHISAMEGRVLDLTSSFRQFNRSLERTVDDLLDDLKRAMMLPFSTILEGFPLLSRNISREQQKEVDLVINGEGIEIDRRILEEMKDPLIHLVRNSIDHGIERPENRAKNDKPRRSTISISVSHMDAGKIEVIFSDDGAGINPVRVVEEAVKKGIISRGEADSLSEQEALSLVFQSGISTSPIITDISGRGLGLAIVREKAEKLGGSIAIETVPGKGTSFRILLPLTIATFRGILVRAADHSFVLPVPNVERTLRVRDEEIKTVENRETIVLNGRAVSFVPLNTALGLPMRKGKSESGFTTVLILNIAEKRIAFGVDEILGEHDVLVKPLGKQLSRVRNIAGAAVLGSGRPVPVLNVQDLMKSAVMTAISPVSSVQAGEAEGGRKNVLVAEDSITSRILLKNILESAGYNVKTAVDGVDAMTALKSDEFDLVVSDVEMPRMDGFDLTAKIRADKKLAELPVVLVTGLESREDRERGIEVGANAYIVKSSFNQGNLLEVIRRLI